jgi:hypothetical protein
LAPRISENLDSTAAALAAVEDEQDAAGAAAVGFRRPALKSLRIYA